MIDAPALPQGAARAERIAVAAGARRPLDAARFPTVILHKIGGYLEEEVRYIYSRRYRNCALFALPTPHATEQSALEHAAASPELYWYVDLKLAEAKIKGKGPTGWRSVVEASMGWIDHRRMRPLLELSGMDPERVIHNAIYDGVDNVPLIRWLGTLCRYDWEAVRPNRVGAWLCPAMPRHCGARTQIMFGVAKRLYVNKEPLAAVREQALAALSDHDKLEWSIFHSDHETFEKLYATRDVHETHPLRLLTMSLFVGNLWVARYICEHATELDLNREDTRTNRGWHAMQPPQGPTVGSHPEDADLGRLLARTKNMAIVKWVFAHAANTAGLIKSFYVEAVSCHWVAGEEFGERLLGDRPKIHLLMEHVVDMRSRHCFLRALGDKAVQFSGLGWDEIRVSRRRGNEPWRVDVLADV